MQSFFIFFTLAHNDSHDAKSEKQNVIIIYTFCFILLRYLRSNIKLSQKTFHFEFISL